MAPSSRRFALPAILIALTLVASGCAAVSSLNSSARTLDTFELAPLPATTAARSGGRILYVAEATAPAAVASDRIVLKPNALEVRLIGDGRWVEAAPAHFRNILARSLAGTGRYALVTTANAGPLPDFTLLTDIDAFEARLQPEGSAAPARIVVSLTLSVVRDADGRLVASRRFSHVADAAGTDALAVVSAFQTAATAVLREGVPWATTVMTGAPGV
jgi:cholesterol transport system auxiliary component